MKWVITISTPKISWPKQAWYARLGLLTSVLAAAVIVASFYLITNIDNTFHNSYPTETSFWYGVYWVTSLVSIALVLALVSLGLPIYWGRKQGFKAVVAIILYETSVSIAVWLLAILMLQGYSTTYTQHF